MNSPYKKVIPLLVVFTVLLASNFIDAAWTAPAGTPSAANNAEAPINVSATNQDKSGGLTVGNFRSDDLIIADGEVRASAYCDAAGLNCLTPMMCADGQVMVANDGAWGCADDAGLPASLAFGVHTQAECTAAGGTVENVGATLICRFAGASCPASWTQYDNWSSVTARSCSGGSGCGNSSCSVGHTWADQSNSCSYGSGGYRNSGGCEPASIRSCSSPLIEIGCY